MDTKFEFNNVINEYKEIESLYGKDFEYKSKVLEEYKKSISCLQLIKNGEEQIENDKKQIWCDMQRSEMLKTNPYMGSFIGNSMPSAFFSGYMMAGGRESSIPSGFLNVYMAGVSGMNRPPMNGGNQEETGTSEEENDLLIEEKLYDKYKNMTKSKLSFEQEKLLLNYVKDYWEKVIEKRYIDEDWARKYSAIIDEKVRILNHLYSDKLEEFLRKIFGVLSDKKKEFRQVIKNVSFEEGRRLNEEYRAETLEMERWKQENEFDLDRSALEEYIKYFKWGSILIDNQLNLISKNKISSRRISKDDVDSALLYMYETTSMEEVNNLLERERYSDNKKMGLPGEMEVEYALKWLDKSYVNIEKITSEKYGEKAIRLYNPEYIDEKQEYDNIVIGKQGIFLIEVKNYVGKLCIDENGNWTRIKKEGDVVGEINPVQQIRRHEKLLRSIVGNDVPIINVICMANAKIVLEGVENSIIPVIKSDMLVEYIENYQGTGADLTKEKMSEYRNIIEEYMI